MAKRCIGIDIGSSCLCAVQLLWSAGQFHIEKVFSTQTRRNTDSLSDILKTLTGQHKFDRRAGVAVSMPNSAVFFRSLETDSAGLEQIQEQDSPSLENDFPIQPDQILTRMCSYHQLPDDKYSVLMAAVSRESLSERLNILFGAKMRPRLIDAAIFAVHSTIAANHPEVTTGTAVIVYINDSCLTLAITRNNNILIVRNIPLLSCSDSSIDSVREQVAAVLLREVEVTWQKIFDGKIDPDSKIYLVAEDNLAGRLKAVMEEKLPCSVTIVDPYAKAESPPGRNGNAAISVAEGLALRVLANKQTAGANFLEADDTGIKPALNLKRELIICTALVAAIVVVSLAGLFTQLSHLETKYTGTKNQIKKVFQSTLPQERNIVNPLAQLDQKLQYLHKDYALLGLVPEGGAGPLDILYTITKSAPSEININLNNMLITPESVRLTGNSQSFESVYNWQRLLQEVPQFTTVDVQDIRRETGSDSVHFIILASLPTMEQK